MLEALIGFNDVKAHSIFVAYLSAFFVLYQYYTSYEAFQHSTPCG